MIRPGAIAQLGERLHGMQEVVGSSPTSSISPDISVLVQTRALRAQRRREKVQQRS
jgi:hypothetical protein